jgi:hypothetical protein
VSWPPPSSGTHRLLVASSATTYDVAVVGDRQVSIVAPGTGSGIARRRRRRPADSNGAFVEMGNEATVRRMRERAFLENVSCSIETADADGVDGAISAPHEQAAPIAATASAARTEAASGAVSTGSPASGGRGATDGEGRGGGALRVVRRNGDATPRGRPRWRPSTSAREFARAGGAHSGGRDSSRALSGSRGEFRRDARRMLARLGGSVRIAARRRHGSNREGAASAAISYARAPANMSVRASRARRELLRDMCATVPTVAPCSVTGWA